MAKKTKAEADAELAAAKTDEERAQAERDEAEAEKAQVVADAAAVVAETKAALDEAQKAHDDAVAEHKKASETLAVKVVYGKHILVDLGGDGQFSVMDAPKNWEKDKPRVLTIGGRNVEHVSDHATGVWQYRAM